MASGFKAVKFTGQFVGLMVGIGFTVYTCTSTKSFLYNAFGDRHSVIGAQNIFIFFICVHWLRVWLGLQFIEEDSESTFGASLKKQISAKTAKSLRIKIAHWAILFTLFWTVALLAGTLGGAYMGLVGLNAFLVLQGACLLLFDWLFWRELTQEGPEFSANRFIVIGDGATLLMILAVVLTSSLASMGRALDQHYVTGWFLFFTGGLLLVFLGEVWCQYGPAALSLIRSLSTKPTKTADAEASGL